MDSVFHQTKTTKMASEGTHQRSMAGCPAPNKMSEPIQKTKILTDMDFITGRYG